MAIKLDMKKAYDRIKWNFIKTILIKFGFHSKWIRWVMVYICTMSYSILISRSPKGKIFPTRGLSKVIIYLFTFLFFVLNF